MQIWLAELCFCSAKISNQQSAKEAIRRAAVPVNSAVSVTRHKRL